MKRLKGLSIKRQVIVGISLLFLVLVVGLVGIFIQKTQSSHAAFREQYPQASAQHVFKPITPEESVTLLSKETGVLFYGFPECPWCQTLIPHLEASAQAAHVDIIYYVNILDARNSQSEAYQHIVNELTPYLKTDAEGRPRLYVPHVVVVKNGSIVASYTIDMTIGNIQKPTPDIYWTQEAISISREQLRAAFGKLQ